jgi:hypothetical protein
VIAGIVGETAYLIKLKYKTMKNINLLRVSIITSVVCFLYYAGIGLYNNSDEKSTVLEAMNEALTLPLLLVLAIVGIYSLVMLIKSSFAAKGYFIPLIITLATAVMLYVQHN